MPTTIDILQSYTPPPALRRYCEENPDMRDAWECCPRGDWMMWIAARLDCPHAKLVHAARASAAMAYAAKDIGPPSGQVDEDADALADTAYAAGRSADSHYAEMCDLGDLATDADRQNCGIMDAAAAEHYASSATAWEMRAAQQAAEPIEGLHQVWTEAETQAEVGISACKAVYYAGRSIRDHMLMAEIVGSVIEVTDLRAR